MELCLNELSVTDGWLHASYEEIESAMNQFWDMICEFRRQIHGRRIVLRTKCGWKAILNTETFQIQRWLHQLEPDRRNVILSVMDRSPYYADAKDAGDQALQMELRVGGDSSEGFLCAYLLDGIAVSFPPEDDRWKGAYVTGNLEQADDTGELQYSQVYIRHMLSQVHVGEHAAYYNGIEYCKQQVATVQDLDEKKAHIFPHLIFSDTYDESLKKTPMGQERFGKIVERLHQLDEFMASGNHDVRSMGDCSPHESEPTMHKYGDLRKFLFAGESRICIPHMRLRDMNWRIHFFPSFETQIAYVGYIGRHLPTVNDPT